MNINEIKKYNHEIRKIQIYNNNQQSEYRYVIARITLNNIPANTTPRFSYELNSNFIPHQRVGNDFFLQLLNDVNDAPYIYVHYFLSEFYTYDEDSIVHVFTDFSKFKTIQNNQYNVEKNDKLKLEYQINDKARDPNWKNIQKIKNNTFDETEKGQYPYQSKYRDNKFFATEPRIIDDEYQWEQTDDEPICEVLFGADDLNDLSYVHDIEDPLNIYTQYRYLPSSNNFHQHYLSLYGSNNKDENNIPRPTETDPIFFDCENMYNINNSFKNATYKLMRNKNILSNNYIYLNKGKKIDLIFNEHTIKLSTNNLKNNCIFSTNSCDNYHIIQFNPEVNANQNPRFFMELELQKGNYYTLSYFIYLIKSQTQYNYLQIRCLDEDNNTFSIYKINNIFLDLDNVFLKQWNYHEINFKADTDNVVLEFIGFNPNDDNESKKNPIYLFNIELTEDSVYNPSLKYSKTDIILNEGNNYTTLPLTELIDQTSSPTVPPFNSYTKKLTLPTPFVKVFGYPKIIEKQTQTPLYGVIDSEDDIDEIDTNEKVLVYKRYGEQGFYYVENKELIDTPIITQYTKAPNNIDIEVRNIFNNLITSGVVYLYLNDNLIGSSSVNNEGVASFYVNLAKYSNYNNNMTIHYEDNVCEGKYSEPDSNFSITVSPPSIKLVPHLYKGVDYIRYGENATEIDDWTGTETTLNPAVIQVNVYNTAIVPNQLVNGGNITLYVNEERVQSTAVLNGKARLYISNDDFTNQEAGTYVLKFEYRDTDGIYPNKIYYNNLIITESE